MAASIPATAGAADDERHRRAKAVDERRPGREERRMRCRSAGRSIDQQRRDEQARHHEGDDHFGDRPQQQPDPGGDADVLGGPAPTDACGERRQRAPRPAVMVDTPSAPVVPRLILPGLALA
jgi:hypothetical protein